MMKALGHYAPWLLAGLVGAVVALALVPAAFSAVPWPVLLGLLVAALVLGVSVPVHNRRLCERCIGSLPLNASGTAERYALRFRVAHLFEHKLFALGYLAVLLGTSMMSTNPVGRFAFAGAGFSLVYLILVYVTHQRLQPWCPHCRHGGEERPVPHTPAPLSSGI